MDDVRQLQHVEKEGLRSPGAEGGRLWENPLARQAENRADRNQITAGNRQYVWNGWVGQRGLEGGGVFQTCGDDPIIEEFSLELGKVLRLL
jgi:hypothetical protein